MLFGDLRYPSSPAIFGYEPELCSSHKWLGFSLKWLWLYMCPGMARAPWPWARRKTYLAHCTPVL
eukprot:15476044-Alexandrium_andersonii.AAC.1